MSGDNFIDKAKGIAKEAVGKVSGKRDVERAGEEEQKEAHKSEEAERLEAEAQQKRNEAAGHQGERTKRES